MEDQQKKKLEEADATSKKDVGGTAQEDMEKLQKERDEYLNGWKRAKADLINYQKDEAKRFQEVMKYGIEGFVRELIPVLDSFELGISAMERHGTADKGIYIIKNLLEEILRKQGLERIKVSAGAPFDPNFHESLGEMSLGEGSASGGEPPQPGTIAVEVESGYMLNGKVVRPARVKLVK
jgi:molecular chaperone GrpE